MITKKEFPILERDSCKDGLILNKFDDLGLDVSTPIPQKALLLFLKENVIKDFVEKNNGVSIILHKTISNNYQLWSVKYKGEDICICQAGVGAPGAAQILDYMIGHGAKKIVACGSCGVLKHVDEGAFLVPVKALRDEGVSYKYLSPTRFVNLDSKFIKSIEKTFKRIGIHYEKCVTWTIDSIFRETKNMIAYRKEEGCDVVEMECASLASVAKFRKISFGQILFAADSLANTKKYDARNFGVDSHEIVLNICLEVISDF